MLTQYNNSTVFVTTNTSFTVASYVLSLDISGVSHGVLLNSNITLNFYFAVSPNTTYLCSYWDFSSRSWRQDGCYNGSSSASHFTCMCEHLTNFAVLADVNGNDHGLSAANLLALELITYIGCGLSIGGMFITLVTLLLFAVWTKIIILYRTSK